MTDRKVGRQTERQSRQTDKQARRQNSLFIDQEYDRTQRPQREVAGAEGDDEVVDCGAALLHGHDDQLVVPSLISSVLEAAVVTVLRQYPHTACNILQGLLGF